MLTRPSNESVVFGAQTALVAILGVLLFATPPTVAASAKDKPTLKEVFQLTEESSKETQPQPQTPQTPIPEDEFGRGTPRTSAQGFLQAARERDYERAAQYLDLRNLPRGLSKKDAPELARHLKFVLDRTLRIDLELVSMQPRGDQNDGLPPSRDRLGQIKTPEKTVDILVQRVPRGDGVYIWKISSKTVAEIPFLYRHYGHGYLQDLLPKSLFDYELFGVEAWFWVAGVLTAALSFVVAFVLTAGLAVYLRRRGTTNSTRVARLMTGPVRFLVLAIVARELLLRSNPPVEVQAILHAATITTIVVVWTVLRLVDFLVEHLLERFRRQGQLGASVFLRPAANAAKGLIVVIALLIWVDNLGFEVTTLLAGLGIGGLAVALAAQKTLENLIGAVALYASQPVSPGDFCRFGDKLGTVEEIGLRYTRVRTLDDTLLSVPNAEFASLHLNNYSKRRKIWYHPRLSLRYETTPEQVRYILVEVRRLLYSHPKVTPDPARIRFTELGAYSLDLDVFAYVSVIDYGEFLEVAEDLNLRIMDIVKNAGSSFAFPSQTLYYESGTGLDQDKARAAEAQVKEWRERKSLYLPAFPREKIAELQGSVEYPPAGSPLSPAGA